MQKLRKLNFFDRTPVGTDGWGSDFADVSEAAGGTNYLFFSTRSSAELLLVDSAFRHARHKIFAPEERVHKLHECKENVFFALTSKGPAAAPRLKFFRVESLSKINAMHQIPVFEQQRASFKEHNLPGGDDHAPHTRSEKNSFVTCCDCLGDAAICLGSANGYVQLVFGPFERNPVLKVISVGDNSPVTSCHFLEQVRTAIGANGGGAGGSAAGTIVPAGGTPAAGAANTSNTGAANATIRVVLFVTTRTSVFSYSLGEIEQNQSGTTAAGIKSAASGAPTSLAGGINAAGRLTSAAVSVREQASSIARTTTAMLSTTAGAATSFSSDTNNNNRQAPSSVRSNVPIAELLGQREILLLHEERSGGADFFCAAVFRSMQALLVARAEGVFSYDPEEGNLSAIPLDGLKLALLTKGPFFVCVTSEEEHKFRVTICLSYPHMRFIAYSALFGARPFRLFAGLQPPDALFLLDDCGKLFKLQEKPKSEQLEVLARKRLFEWAAILVEKESLDTAAMCRIYKLHGDALYEKRMYDHALQVYLKSVDVDLPLETSYVVEKYLEAHKIGHIAKYLQKLHERPGLAEPGHTRLLFQCYTKRAEDESELGAFLEQIPVEHYDYRVGLEVLEQTPGFMPYAVQLAKKAKDGSTYVRLLLAQDDAHEALGFLKQKTLPAETRLGILLTQGGGLLQVFPAEVHRLLLEVIRAREQAITEDELSEIVKIYTLQDIQAASSTKTNGANTNHSAPMGYLEAFLRELVKVLYQLPQKWVDSVLLPTFLECLLRKWARQREQREQSAREILKLLEEHAARSVFLARVPQLCGMVGFGPGLVYAYEKLGEYQALVAYHLEANDDLEGLLQSCRRCGAKEPRLWAQALACASVGEGFLGEKANAGSTSIIESSYREDKRRAFQCETLIPEALNQASQMPVLSGLRALCDNEVPLKNARGYLQEALEKLQVLPSEKLKQDQLERQKMEEETEAIKTKPRVFSAAKCYECGLNLEPPSVHFFCMHSFHLYCVNEEASACPKCAKTVAPPEAPETEHSEEAFFKYLKASRNADGGFAVVADYFGRNVFE